MLSMLPCSEACERNKTPILALLRTQLAERRHVLEIGSGTGQHAVYFAANLPHLTWRPSEREEQLPLLRRRVTEEGTANLLAPVALDVSAADWPPEEADAWFTANTLHIMGWTEVQAFFRHAGVHLPAAAPFCIYGPFRYDSVDTAPSNREFDAWLKARDPRSGLRDMRDLQPLALANGLALEADHAMPANNRLLVLRKQA